ncbi:hypothetical protein BSKO_13557 [Bryopsis sp. KO-2023]|nr:hypothetical protein BSKO_13557 [Bryopsis sp. KO-2023]
MPFRALIRTVDPDGNLKVGLDELALYFLRSRGWLKKPQCDANGNPLETVHEHHDGEDYYSDEDGGRYEDRDISYAEMVAGSIDDMLMGVLDDVVGLLPGRGAMDLGYSQDAYVHPRREQADKSFDEGPSGSGSKHCDGDEEDEDLLEDETRSMLDREPRRFWQKLGMLGAAALGFIASTRA